MAVCHVESLLFWRPNLTIHLYKMDRINTLKRKITTALKLSGFTIKSEGSLFLAEQLSVIDEDQQSQWIDKVTDHIQNQKLSSVNIEKKHIEIALNELNRKGSKEDETVFSVINAFDIPSFTYNRQRKKFELCTERRNFFPHASRKSKFLRERYEMLLQKTTRHELFSSSVEGISSEIKKFKLYNVENLLSTSKVNEVVVLGLFTQLEEGKFFIEDPTGAIPLKLQDASFHSGFFCDGCFVLAEGKYQDGELKVNGLGFPPPEPAKSSRAFFGTINTWGGPSSKLLKYSNYLMDIESSKTEATIVFVSDVRLDNPLVLEKLEVLFSGYNGCPPVAIVLMGPFAKGDENIYSVSELFHKLGDILQDCDQIKQHTDLVLVPSAEDPSFPNILPRGPLPEVLVKGLKQKVPRTILASNPCRLQYCTQQIVVCRTDLITKLCRNTVHFPGSGQLEDHFSRTLICQGTLAPFHPIILPIYWDYDAALTLYPLPDLIVIGDPSESFSCTHHECTIANTGSFVKSKFQFKVYVPSSRLVEDSSIPDTNEE